MRQIIANRLLSIIFCFLFISNPMISNGEAESDTNLLYLTGGNLLDVRQGKIIPNALVIIQGDTIVYAGPGKTYERSPDSAAVDCSGKTILPGLFDAHIHLGGASTIGYIYIDEGRKLSAFLYSGVTSVFDLGGVPNLIFALREKEKKNGMGSPRIFAVGPVFTSPKGHGTEYGVPMSVTPMTEKEARVSVWELNDSRPNHIKIIYEKGSERFDSLSYELMEAIIDEAHKNDIPVITHVITLEQAKDAIKAGTDGLAHMITDREISQEFLAEMRQKNVYCIPTMALFDALSGGMWTIQDSLKKSLCQGGVSQEIIADLAKKKEIPGINDSFSSWRQTIDFAKINTKKMADHGIKLALGTDAGNPAVFFGPSVHREMELMVDAGISPAEAIKAATMNAAEIVGQKDTLGTVSKGKLADILVVDGNPLDDIRNTQNIYLVIKNGEILDRDKLARKINPPEETPIQTGSEPMTPPHKTETVFTAEIDPSAKTTIIEAKKILKKGVDTWDPDLMKTARDRLLGLIAGGKNRSFYPMYYIALCDYRLATYYLTLAQMDKAGPYIKEGQGYLQKAMEINPDFGEMDAFYAYMLGFEIAIAPEKAMSLGLQIYQYFGSAFEKSPENPRVHLLKGVSDLFTPEQYGGGADRAIKTLEKCVGLYERENIEDPVFPSWGKDEAYTFLGMAHIQKGNTAKAVEFFQKALEVNPENRLARDELKKIEK